MNTAETANPCDGASLPCEDCHLPSRFRRERPKTRPLDTDALVWDMGIRRPERPLPLRDFQVLCEHHIKDWHGPPTTYGD